MSHNNNVSYMLLEEKRFIFRPAKNFKVAVVTMKRCLSQWLVIHVKVIALSFANYLIGIYSLHYTILSTI